jgi:hypothetical protein
MRAVEAKVTALFNGGARGGEAEKYHYVRGERLQMEIDLKHEEMRVLQKL